MLDLLPKLPALVWGRDELGAGEMWNSNSIIAWLLASAGLRADSIRPPSGRAQGGVPAWPWRRARIRRNP